jgi:YjgF/chorismate_mutase-like, putative endoribonuclease
MTVDKQIRALGLVLPEPFRSPTGTAYPFSWVRVRGNRAYISGHLPLQAGGTLAEPRGKVGKALTIEQGAAAARLVGLAMLGSLQRELGELERITVWRRVLGMVNVAPGATQLAGVSTGSRP